MKLHNLLIISLFVSALGIFIYHSPLLATSILSILFVIYLIIIKKEIGIPLLLFMIPALNKMLMLIFHRPIPPFYYAAFFIGIIVYSYYNFIYGKKISYKLGIFDYSILLFFFYVIFSVIFVSSNKIYGLEKLVFIILSLLMSYTCLIICYKYSLDKITTALVIFGIIISIFSFYNMLGIKSPLFQYTFLGRFSFLDLNPIFLARYISICILANFYWIFDLLHKNEKSTYAVILLISISIFEFYIISLTASRGPILVLIICILVYGFIIGKFSILKFLRIIAIILILGFISLYFIPQKFMERLLSANLSGQITIISRYLGNIEALRNFWSHKILGIGFGSYIFKFGDIETMIYPHNIFTEILAEGGVVGLILLINIVIICFFKYLLKLKVNLNKFAFLVTFFLAGLLNANISGHIGKNFYFWVSLGMIYGVYLKSVRDKKNEENSNCLI